MENIDLDAIIHKQDIDFSFSPGNLFKVKLAMREAIHQFAVLASENATIDDGNGSAVYADQVTVDKQSILDCEKLVK